MRSRIPLLTLLAVSCLVSGAFARGPESKYWYIDPVAGTTRFDNARNPAGADIEDAFTAGGRIGYMLGTKLGLELAGDWTSLDIPGAGDVTQMRYSGNLMVMPIITPLGNPFVTVGGGYASRSDDAEDAGTFDLSLGWKVFLSDHVGLRLEARNVLDIDDPVERSNLNDVSYFGGLSFAFGGETKDTDADGIPDSKDKCPSTPTGAKVDEKGCPTDADKDGVFDGIDKCEGTLAGAKVDASGCPTDADGDGVPDGIDQCADTPHGATVDAKGCPTDSDGDKVPDGIDQCAGTAAGMAVDEKGCPRDADGDGIPDGVDQCPGTAAGVQVDATGCPAEVAQRETELRETGMIRLNDVNFETGKAVLAAASVPSLDAVGQLMAKWPTLKLEVGGHTDSKGAAAANQKLSQQRAQAVVEYLVSKYPSISRDLLVAKGYGESKPAVPNTTAENLAKNRRVEFKILNPEEMKREAESREKK